MNPRHAKHAVATLFTLHGMIVGTWVPNVPLAKERLDVGTGIFGLALLCAAIGAMIAMPLAGALINRVGSARVSILAGIGFCLCLALPVNAPTLVTFALGLFCMGACMGSMDVAMNAHGIRWNSAWASPSCPISMACSALVPPPGPPLAP